MKLTKLMKRRLMAGTAATITISLLLFGGYFVVQTYVKPVRVPVVNLDTAPLGLNGRTQITKDYIHWQNVPARAVPPNVKRSEKDIVGKWVAVDKFLAPNSYFYSEVLVDQEDLPDYARMQLRGDEELTEMTVKFDTSKGNNLVPGQYIHLQFEGLDREQKKFISEHLMENVRIVGVKDGKSADVFSQKTSKKPAKSTPQTRLVLLALTKEQSEWLSIAEQIGEVTPQPISDEQLTALKQKEEDLKGQGQEATASVVTVVNQKMIPYLQEKRFDFEASRVANATNMGTEAPAQTVHQ
ncbi:RcpC/CpaB family pilus assembly protein [Brevibacillus centrosporus]|uniref:RcpC/CpaB family pilus assembly protein n=1 Tax=Brevibacillus centrosporus TaxID=54910 RepID=UPI003D1DF890